MTFPKALEFLHNRVGKHNTVLSLTEVIIVLAALSAKVNFFPGVGGSREDNRQTNAFTMCFRLGVSGAVWAQGLGFTGKNRLILVNLMFGEKPECMQMFDQHCVFHGWLI